MSTDFPSALQALRSGARMTRTGWNGPGMYVAVHHPPSAFAKLLGVHDPNICKYPRMTLPYLYMYTAQGELVPWVASHSDLLAYDWEPYQEDIPGF